eukprot:Em0004g506a
MFRCPTCERNSSIPVGGASVLPQNLHLGFEVEVAGYMSKMMNNSEVCCDECVDGRNGLAVVFCCMCHQFPCKVCRDYHSSSRRFSKHKIVLLDQAGARQLHTTMKPRDHYCSQPSHYDNKLNFYYNSFDPPEGTVEKMVRDIGHYTDMASQILQTHTDYEIVAFGGLISTELQATLKRIQSIFLTSNQHSNITVSVQTDDLVRQLSKLGEIIVFSPCPSSSTWTSTSVARVGTRYHVQVQRKTSKGKEYPHGSVEVKGEMRSKTHNGAVVYGEVEDHRDGTYTITLTPQSVGPHQLLITMDGQHIQNSPNDLDVRPKRDYHTLCKAQQVIQCNEPRCVAIHDNGDIHVGRKHSCCSLWFNTIKVFTKEGVYVRMYGDPKCPIGIAIDDEGYSLVSEWSGTCLSIYDPEGIKICKVGNLNKPRDIALDCKDDSVFIAKYGANTVLKYCV